MWDDYGVIRPGRMPLDVYENGQIVFTQNPVAFDVPIGTVVGTISVINATPTYKLSVGNNPYFAISGNNLVSKAALVGGVDFVQIFAIKGFKRIAAVVRIVVSGNAPPTPPAGQFLVGIGLSGAEIDFPQFPQPDEMGYLANRSLKLFRLQLCWSKINIFDEFYPAAGIQQTPFGDLNTSYLTGLKSVIDIAIGLGCQVIPDIHQFGGAAGISGSIFITSISAVGTLATVTYSSTSGAPLVDGCKVSVKGSTLNFPDPSRTPDAYDGTWIISNVTPTTFQYTMNSVPVVNPAVHIQFAHLIGQEQADIGTNRLPIAALVDLWEKISAWIKANFPDSAFFAYDIMNEWAISDQTIAFQANQAVTTALRAAGDNAVLLYEGNNFSGSWNWTDTNDNFYQIVDPANRNMMSPHAYPDHNNSGQNFNYATEAATPGSAPTGINTNPQILVQRMERQYMPWARLHGKATVVGEHAVSNDYPPLGNNDYADWNTIEDNFLAYCRTNAITVLWYGNGPSFGSGYPFNLSPTSASDATVKDFTSAGVQAAQFAIIDKYTGYTGPQSLAYRINKPTSLTLTVGDTVSFTVDYNGVIASDITFTLVDLLSGSPAGGIFTPSTITFAAGINARGSFTYTAENSGSIQITATNNGGLSNPPAISLSVLPIPATTTVLPLTGMNITGMESSGNIFPISQGTPLAGSLNDSYMAYMFARGMNAVRAPFKRERIQPRLLGALSNALSFPGGASGLDALDSAVNDAAASGLNIILDMHDFGGTTATVDITSVSVSGTTATCTVADTSILVAGLPLTLGATATTNPTPTLVGAITIINSTTFTIPVPGGTASSGATTGTFIPSLGSAGYTNAMFADSWVKIAARYASNVKVVIDLQNEPHGISSTVMQAAAQAAITALRLAGFTNHIMYEDGGSFSSAFNFSATMGISGPTLTDPLNKLIYQVHCYLDSGANGGSPNPSAVGVGAPSLIDCTEYARAKGLKLFLGEYGISTSTAMIIEVSAQLDYLSNNTDVWVGQTAWMDNTYVLLPAELRTSPFTYPPPGGVVTDQVQMATLTKHGPSSYSVSAPSGIDMNWVPGFDGGQIPATTSVGTVLTGPLKALCPNIDGAGTSTFALVSNPGSVFSINGSKELVLAAALTDLTTYPFSIQVTTAHAVSATFTESVICNSVTTIDPATVNLAVYTLSNGNKTIMHTGAGTAVSQIYITKSKSGGLPVYFECRIDSGFTGGNQPVLFTRVFGPSSAAPGLTPPGNYYLTNAGVAGGSSPTAAIGSNVQGTVATSTYAASQVAAGDTFCFYWHPGVLLGIRKGSGNWNNNVANDPTVGALDISSLPQPLFISYFAFQNGQGCTFNFGATSFAFTQPGGTVLL